MKLRVSLGLLSLVLIVTALWWTNGDRRGPRSAAQSDVPVDAATLDPVEGADDPVIAATPAPAPSAEPQRMAQAPSTRPDATPESDGLAEIRGRFSFPDGASAAGVACAVHGWTGNQEREMKYGLPEDWTDPAAESDADGRFSIRFDPPRAFQFTLDASLPGYAEVSWRWSEIEPGATLDLGEIVLARGGVLEGRIVDGEGNAVVGQDWIVYARSHGGDASRGRDETQVIAPADPRTGRYRAEDVLPGRVRLKAYSRMANWIEGPTVTLAAGETQTVDIVYAGPDNAHRITVTTFSDPFYVMSNPDPEHIKLIAPDGEVRTAEKVRGSSQSHSFDNLEPGTYAVEIDDPRYRPWSAAAVRPGTEVNLTCRAAAPWTSG